MQVEKIALLDLDGTVADYAGQLKRDLDKLKSPEEPSFELDFNDDVPQYIKERMKLIKNSDNWWYNLPPLSPGFRLMHLAQEIGFDVHVLTKGPYTTSAAWTQKYEWCRNFLPSDVKITITEDKGLVYGNILIDDYPAYVQRWLTWRPRGLAVMPVANYNKDFSHPNVVIYDGRNFEEVRDKMQQQMDR
jgi:5'(3')-deoxyribonucleotidase